MSCVEEIFQARKVKHAAAGHSTNVGDEGVFAPNLRSSREAQDFIMQAIEGAGYKAGDEVVLGLDCAATEYFKEGSYAMTGEGLALSSEKMADWLKDLVTAYPIVSIEDGMAEDDWAGWRSEERRVGHGGGRR